MSGWRGLGPEHIRTARYEIARERAARRTDKEIADFLTRAGVGDRVWLPVEVEQFMTATRASGPGFIATAAPDHPRPRWPARIET